MLQTWSPSTGKQQCALSARAATGQFHKVGSCKCGKWERSWDQVFQGERLVMNLGQRGGETTLSNPCSLVTWLGRVTLECPSEIKHQHMCKSLCWNNQSKTKQNIQRILSWCRIWNYSWAYHRHCRADPQPLEDVESHDGIMGKWILELLFLCLFGQERQSWLLRKLDCFSLGRVFYLHIGLHYMWPWCPQGSGEGE